MYLKVLQTTDDAYLFGFRKGSMWVPKKLCHNLDTFMKEVSIPKKYYDEKLRKMHDKTPMQKMLGGKL